LASPLSLIEMPFLILMSVDIACEV